MLTHSQVKEVNPLKQGLKQIVDVTTSKHSKRVKEVNPLKQGLKHVTFFLLFFQFIHELKK